MPFQRVSSNQNYKFIGTVYYMSRNMTKPTKWLCAQRRQISLGICPVWSESSLSAWRKLGSLATHSVHSEGSDQTGQMPMLIWVFAGRTCHIVGFVMLWLILFQFDEKPSDDKETLQIILYTQNATAESARLPKSLIFLLFQFDEKPSDDKETLQIILYTQNATAESARLPENQTEGNILKWYLRIEFAVVLLWK